MDTETSNNTSSLAAAMATGLYGMFERRGNAHAFYLLVHKIVGVSAMSMAGEFPTIVKKVLAPLGSLVSQVLSAAHTEAGENSTFTSLHSTFLRALHSELTRYTTAIDVRVPREMATEVVGLFADFVRCPAAARNPNLH